ncbi:MAG: cyclic nucleotide-binding domain-containing protein [Candidatus Woesearchaeota archaeon]
MGKLEEIVLTRMECLPMDIPGEAATTENLVRSYRSLPAILRKLNDLYIRLASAMEFGLLSSNFLKNISSELPKDLPAVIAPKGLESFFAKTEEYEPNAKIFRHGDEARDVYLVKSGMVDIILDDRSGSKKIATLEPGTVFGEMAMIDNQKRSANAFARGPTSVYTANKEDLLLLIEKGTIPLTEFLVSTMRSRAMQINCINTKLLAEIEKNMAGSTMMHLQNQEPLTHNELIQAVSDLNKQHALGRAFAELHSHRKSIEHFAKSQCFYEIEIHRLKKPDLEKIRDTMLEKGFLSGMIRYGYWNPEHSYKNRRFLFRLMESTNAPAEKWVEFADKAICQHAGRRITEADCEIAIAAYKEAELLGTGIEDKLDKIKAYAKTKGISLSTGTDTNHPFFDINIYQPTPGIGEIVLGAQSRMLKHGIRTKNSHIATNFQAGCALEPLSDKTGCTTRFKDLSEHQVLDQYVVAGVNLGIAVLDFLTRLEDGNQRPIYSSCYDMQVASKLHRRGGRLNQGIIEFGFPLIAAMAQYDSENKMGPDYLFEQATNLMKHTTREDVEQLIAMKQFAHLLSRIERPVHDYKVRNVYDYYAQDLHQAEENRNLNSIIHNRQFVEGFPDVKKVYNELNRTTGNLNERAVSAYNKVFHQEHYKEIGRGLAADFIAIALFLTFSYSKEREIVW